jgi:hypothetical protein
MIAEVGLEGEYPLYILSPSEIIEAKGSRWVGGFKEWVDGWMAGWVDGWV